MQIKLFDLPKSHPFRYKVNGLSFYPYLYPSLYNNILIAKDRSGETCFAVLEYEDTDCDMHPCWSFKLISSFKDAK